MYTSITDNAAHNWVKTAKHQATLACSRITGFHLLKTKTGATWRYRYKDAAGKVKVAKIGTYPLMKPQVAGEVAANWRIDNADPIQAKQAARDAALSEEAKKQARSLRTYLDGPYTRHQGRKKDGGKHTLAIIKSNFEKFLDRDMASLTKQDIHAWQDDREKAGRKHATLERAYGALRTLLRHAFNEGALDEFPLTGVALHPPTAAEKADSLNSGNTANRRLLTDEEISALFDGLDKYAHELRLKRRNSREHGKSHLTDLDGVAYPHWFIPFFHMGYWTGLRPGDLYTLTWQELNLTFGTLVKIPEKTKHHKKPTQINMPLHPDLVPVMQAWYEQQGKPSKGLVFPSEVKIRALGVDADIQHLKMDKKAHTKPWGHVLKHSGLEHPLDFYSLRHNFISQLVANGVPLFEVAKLVGHKGTAMIEQHYGHLSPASARSAILSLGQPARGKHEVNA